MKHKLLLLFYFVVFGAIFYFARNGNVQVGIKNAFAQYPTIPEIPGYCGDGTCDNDIGEACDVCVADCGECGGPTNTPTPTPTPVYTISGTVYVDQNANGAQDCVGACDDGPGDELGYGGATVGLSGDGSRVTNASGFYSFGNLIAGSYGVTLTVPGGYVETTTNPVSLVLPPDGTANFGIEPTPQCQDGIDNNGNTLVDCDDPGCHSDGDAGNPLTCDDLDPRENPECSDSLDNDGDTFTDFGSDPDCTDADDPSETIDLPVCPPGSLSIDTDPIGSGETGTITISGCTSSEPPTYTWPPPETVPPGGDGGSNTDGSGPSTDYTASDNICSDTTIEQCVNVSNSGGTNVYCTNFTATPSNTLSGTVLLDSAGNNCESGATPYTDGATLTLYPDGTLFDTTDGSGSYLINDTTSCGNRDVVISSISGYETRKVRFDSGSWSDPTSANTYSMEDSSGDHTVDFCISNIAQWFQTTTGDVRMSTLTNRVPSGKYASLGEGVNGDNASLFFSSGFASNFGSGEISQRGWKVDNEYEYEEDAKNRNGTTSYSYYVSQISQKGISTTALPGCSGSDCTLSSLDTGIYTHTGDINIVSYTQKPGAHITLLINGNVAIKDNIDVPEGASNLLILAAKGNIAIDKTIGTTTLTSTTTQIEGIFTAEGNITVEGDVCPTTARRLNVGGALIASSFKPFQTEGAGSFDNNRSLCIDDKDYPSVYISPRFDFITQLTNFYKTSTSRWREVEP